MLAKFPLPRNGFRGRAREHKVGAAVCSRQVPRYVAFIARMFCSLSSVLVRQSRLVVVILCLFPLVEAVCFSKVVPFAN